MPKILFVLLILSIYQLGLLAVPYEIGLSGGTGGRQSSSSYTAPNGTQVTASAISYAYSNWYELRHMFDNTFGGTGDNYWLPNTHGTTSVLINLDKIYFMT